MEHALITGGAGFIGRHLVDRLLGEGWRVTVVDNAGAPGSRDAAAGGLPAPGAKGWYRAVQADIRNLRELESQLDGGYDVIVHLAARAEPVHCGEDAGALVDVNVRGTANLLDCARRWNVRQFVFASSGEVYGANPRAPWREDDMELSPVSAYAASKIAGEALGRAYSHRHGIRFIALRLFGVYGPGQPAGGLDQWARAIFDRRPAPLYETGSQLRDFTYVADIVEGIRAAMSYGDLPFEVINLGSGAAVSLCELIQCIERAVGATALLEPRPGLPSEPPQVVAHIGKAQRLLGYHPNTPLDEGLRELAVWLAGSPGRDLLDLDGALRAHAGEAGGAPGLAAGKPGQPAGAAAPSGTPA